MSQSSRFLSVLWLLGAAAGLAYSAPAADMAILATGPSIRHGLPYVSANIIEFYRGTYRAPSHSKEPLDVIFTATSVPRPDAWTPAPCSAYRVFTVSASPSVFFYDHNGQWSLFFSFPSGFSDPCLFADTFIDRFIYFLGITQNSPLSSFPAVLNLGG
ncbi:MAG TPA: hypothetical protein VMV68_09320 [Spirochaetia bacterium]|nr:hypothetical protein [Spirochaetia bacterium]